jgi:hypothetical protein
MYAHAIKLLGPDASPRAWHILRAVANASWELAGPDGDLAYYGRSQEEAWVLGLTAYGAEVAADGATDDQASRFRALAARAMDRLGSDYRVGARGLWITPATAQDLKAARHGLDVYADSVAYVGLALVATNWAASVEDHTASDAGVASDRPSSYVVGQDSSRIALVRTPKLWFAVKQARSDNLDLRYDFGLVAMKLQDADGSWTNVTPSLPEVKGKPDSAGPVLETPHGKAFPSGSRMSVAQDGAVTVHGSFAYASGREVRASTFSFRPAGDCVTMSFELRQGERVVYSAFVRQVEGMSVAGVHDSGQRVTIAPAAARVSVEHRPYSSGSDASLDRVRFTIASVGEIRISTCSAH